MNPLVSIVITTYNRYELLKNIINSIYKQTYKNIEMIVSDDCSTDDTSQIKNDFPNIKYIKTPQNLGYAKNLKFAFQFVKGEYLLFLSDDDELIYDKFIKIGVEKLTNSDIFIARSATKFNNKLYKKEHNFKNFYTKIDFFEFLKEVHYYYIDYFTFSSCIFKTSILKKIEPFETLFDFACDVDTASILKYLDKCEKIYFFDKVVYVWNKPNNNSLSGNSNKDMAHHTLEMLSSALNLKKNLSHNIYEEYYNGYVSYVFNAVLSDYYASKNEKFFSNLLYNIQDEFYIYGKGGVGLELKNFLDKNGIKVLGFIDDYRKDNDIITFDEFIKNPKNVIIASYKFKDIYRIYKKLAKLNIKVFDLFGDE